MMKLNVESVAKLNHSPLRPMEGTLAPVTESQEEASENSESSSG
jgi:hypothetical protein